RCGAGGGQAPARPRLIGASPAFGQSARRCGGQASAPPARSDVGAGEAGPAPPRATDAATGRPPRARQILAPAPARSRSPRISALFVFATVIVSFRFRVPLTICEELAMKTRERLVSVRGNASAW